MRSGDKVTMFTVYVNDIVAPGNDGKGITDLGGLKCFVEGVRSKKLIVIT